MEEKISIVFSWDPRSKTWMRERGPEDAVPPPAEPIDDGALQTYFLDPTNGKWCPTILGLRARQVSVELKDLYRAPLASGLAIIQKDTTPRLNVERHDARSGGFPMKPVAILIIVLLVIGAGAFGAQAMFGSNAPSLDDVAGALASAAANASLPVAQPSASASASASADASATPDATQAPAVTNAPVVRTVAPTAPPAPRTIRLSAKLPTGTQVVYSGPAAVPQNSSFQGIFSVVLPSGQGGNESLTVYLGNPSGASTSALANKPDANGNYVLTLKTAGLPKGDQPLSVIYGTTAGIYTLGTITIQ